MKRFGTIILAAMMMLAAAGTALALDPRDGIPAPPGTAVMLFYYNYVTGHDSYVQGTRVSDNTTIKSTSVVFRPLYYGQVGSFPWAASLIIPTGDKTLHTTTANQGVSGLGDISVQAHIWPIARPKDKFWFAVGGYITGPTGDYHNNKVINMGNNVWAFKPETGIVKGFGNFFFDLYVNGTFYTDNDDYGIQSRTLERDPLLTTEVKLSYNITKDFFVSADYFYYYGAQSRVENMAWNMDKQNDHEIGVSLGYNFGANHKLLLATRDKVKTENSLDANTLIRLKYTYLW